MAMAAVSRNISLTTATAAFFTPPDSIDGVSFSNDTAVNVPAGYNLLAAAVTTIGGQGALVAAFADSSGNGHYGITTDGTNFTIEGSVALPAGMTVNSLLIESGLIKFYGGISENGGANTGIELATAPLPADVQGLTLDGATISGTAISGHAVIDVTGSSTIDGNASVTDAQITVESQQTLSFGNATLDNVSVQNSGTVQVGSAISAATLFLGGNNNPAISGGTLSIGALSVVETDNSNGNEYINSTIQDVTVNNSGTILAGVFGDVRIENSTVANAGGMIEAVGASSIVELSGATIEGGTLYTGPVIQNPGGGNSISVTDQSGTALSVFDGSTNAVSITGDVGVFAGGAARAQRHHPRIRAPTGSCSSAIRPCGTPGIYRAPRASS